MSVVVVESFSSRITTHQKYINLSAFDLRKEKDRLATFYKNGWVNSHVSADDLAKFGFFFFSTPDQVKCYFCELALADFEAGDTALGEHLKWSPNCPLIKQRRETENIPIDAEALLQLLPTPSYDECGFTQKARRKSKVEDETKYPEFKLLSQRIKSFETWPPSIPKKPQELAEAGFFYSGQSDLTICFACGLKVIRWEATDNVWMEHKKYIEEEKKECYFLKLNHETVKLNEQAQSKILEIPKSETSDHNDSGSESSSVQFESLCKICLERRSSVIFMPCRHVAVCGQCVFGIEDDCPICRTPIKEKINLFYA